VSLFHLEAVGPTVAFLVKRRFYGTPMGGTSMAVVGCTGGCHGACCRRGVAHHKQCALDFLDVLGKGSVGGNHVVDGCIYLDECIGKVV
jgi:hypothetical protein